MDILNAELCVVKSTANRNWLALRICTLYRHENTHKLVHIQFVCIPIGESGGDPKVLRNESCNDQLHLLLVFVKMLFLVAASGRRLWVEASRDGIISRNPINSGSGLQIRRRASSVPAVIYRVQAGVSPFVSFHIQTLWRVSLQARLYWRSMGPHRFDNLR